MSALNNSALIGASGSTGYQIGRSVRLRNSASAYLSRTFGSNGNQQQWTWSGWTKAGRFGSQQPIFNAYSNTQNYGLFTFSANAFIDATDKLKFYVTVSNVGQAALETVGVFRDPSAWYHVVLQVDTTQATSTNRIRIYVNGVLQTLTGTQPSQNTNLGFFNTTSVPHQIGALATGTYGYYDGYLAEINFIDGQSLPPSSFGETNATTGVWQPKRYTGTYGTNGFYLPMDKPAVPFTSDFLVIGGGGGGGSNRGGGGGAGGYRTSVGTSGGGAAAESPLALYIGVPYTVTVGAGGGSATNGSNSVFASITSLGGGRGEGATSGGGSTGGSGGGGSGDDLPGYAGTANQGYTGGAGSANGGSGRAAGGGGGAGAVGASAVNGTFTAGNGGAGVASSITGSSVTRAGGGGGGYLNNGTAGTAGSGGAGGGGAGASGSSGGTGSSGTANTGSGGGGSAAVASGGSGGSGVVIIRIPDTRTATFSGGVTSSLSTAVPGYKIYTVTATSTTTETVTFS
jgi:hypothetical protein